MIGGEIDPKNTPRYQDYFGALLRDPNDEPKDGSSLPDIYYRDARGRLVHGFDTETWDLYETVLRVWVEGTAVGKSKIGELKKKTIQTLIDQIRSKRSYGTARRYGSCIRRILTEAIADEMIKENPADAMNYGKKGRQKAYVLSKKQSLDLPSELYAFSPRLSAMIVVELDAGVRPGEVCGFRAEDLDMPEPGCWAIWVRRSIDRKGNPKNLKDDEQRLVYLTDDAIQAIAENLKGRRSGYIFLTDQGKPLTPDYL